MKLKTLTAGRRAADHRSATSSGGGGIRTPKTALVVIAGITTLGSAAHADAVNPTGYDLYQQCRNNERSCADYLRGVWDAWIEARRLANFAMADFIRKIDRWRVAKQFRELSFCVPSGPVSAGQLSLVLQKWAREKPGSLSLPAYVAAESAFQYGFPCDHKEVASSQAQDPDWKAEPARVE